MDEVGGPDCTVDVVAVAGNAAPSRDIGIRDAGAARDTSGDRGIGVAPPQQAENMLVPNLDVALYIGVIQDHGSLARDQKAIEQPSSDGLRTGKKKKTAVKKQEKENSKKQNQGRVTEETTERGHT